jgi:hypothetical protein
MNRKTILLYSIDKLLSDEIINKIICYYEKQECSDSKRFICFELCRTKNEIR